MSHKKAFQRPRGNQPFRRRLTETAAMPKKLAECGGKCPACPNGIYEPKKKRAHCTDCPNRVYGTDALRANAHTKRCTCGGGDALRATKRIGTDGRTIKVVSACGPPGKGKPINTNKKPAPVFAAAAANGPKIAEQLAAKRAAKDGAASSAGASSSSSSAPSSSAQSPSTACEKRRCAHMQHTWPCSIDKSIDSSEPWKRWCKVLAGRAAHGTDEEAGGMVPKNVVRLVLRAADYYDRLPEKDRTLQRDRPPDEEAGSDVRPRGHAYALETAGG